jgi:phage-related protein
MDATGTLIEASTVIGDWFNGSTANVPNSKTYAWLGTVNNSASTETTTSSGTYPLTYPFSYPQLQAGGGPQTVTNDGNAPTPPVYTIAGPATSPGITIADSAGSRRIVFNLQLAAGEQLVIDVLNRTVTLGVGGASRYGFSSGVPIENLYLLPGTSTISLDGTGDSTTSLTVAYRDADI